ncbi:acyl carrier protein-like protein [Naematelia encephala]|uniref:Acyl carrier protein n=1 Tax=Naematelia encephala TaxID=71784 RepID=A0A1Y2ATR3_9TREE|nr:acyl carrier protein-like protein [Naematelia encephala]
MYRALPVLRTAIRPTFVVPVAKRLAFPVPAISSSTRSYASGGGLSKEAITERVLDIMKDFDKVNQDKLTPNASFTSDLGLDSLDAVEVVMAIEEEFAVEIPDAEADEITTVGQAIEYIAKRQLQRHFANDLFLPSLPSRSYLTDARSTLIKQDTADFSDMQRFIS